MIGAKLMGVGTDFDVDAKAHFYRLSGTDSQLRYDLNELILGLKSDGLWTKIDVLCVAHDVEADSLLNLKGHIATVSPDSSKGGSPVFTANEGFLMSSGNNIDMGVTESAATLYGLYDGNIMVYTRTFNQVGTADGTIIGTASASFIAVDDATPDDVAFFLQNGGQNWQQDIPVGFIGASVMGATDRNFRINDSALPYTGLKTHTLEAVTTVKVGSAFNNISACVEQIAAWGIGGGLTAVELGLYENRIRTFMQRRGTDVY